MEERKDDDDDNSSNLSSSKSNRGSESQRRASSSSASKRNSSRSKHAADDVFSDDSSAGGPNSGRSLSYPHYAFNSSPPPSTYQLQQHQLHHHHHHHHHSSSSEEIRNPSLLPPLSAYIQPNVVTAGAFVTRKAASVSMSSADGTLTLERAMSEFGGAPGTVPEFVGTGGGSGIFRVPVRAAMHPGRPPALELRPHPLRETQCGSFLRTIASTDTQLWAGQESGLRFWSFTDIFDGWSKTVAKKGDEESAPFRESKRGRTSPVLCMVVDAAMGFIWTGHKDGKIRSWKIVSGEGKVEDDLGDGDYDGDGCGRDGGGHFREGLSWQAHRHPVLSMVISSYGNNCSQFIFNHLP